MNGTSTTVVAPLTATAAVAAGRTIDDASTSSSSQSVAQRMKHSIAGSIAGVISKTMLQPLDLVMTRMQVQDGMSQHEYRGIRHAITQIVRVDGVTGLYRGLTPSLIGNGISWGIYFGSYNFAKQSMRHQLGITSATGSLPAMANLTCAASAGIVTTLITNPIWMVKTRWQLQGKDVVGRERQYSGMIGAFRSIIRDEGIIALYRGLTPALLLVSNGAFEFAAYEELKKAAIRHCTDNSDEKQLGPHHFLAMGAAAKVCASTLTFPLSVTRARLYQRNPDYLLSSSAAANSSGRTIDMKYRDMHHVITSVMRSDGIYGFYRGLVPQLMKTAPASAITFACYEGIVRTISSSSSTT